MLGEGFAHRLLAVERRDLRGLFGPGRILGGVGHQLLELQFQLINQPGRAFGAVTVMLALEQRDLELEPRDHRLRGRNHRARLRQFGLGGRQLGAEFFEV